MVEVDPRDGRELTQSGVTVVRRMEENAQPNDSMALTYTCVMLTPSDWPGESIELSECTVYKTSAWLTFLAKTQGGRPVRAALMDGSKTVGYFTGVLVHKFGMKILGGPFPGWTTDYMGLTLRVGTDRRQAIRAVMDLAFRELGCVHIEVMDRHTTEADLQGLGCQYRLYRTFEVDLAIPLEEIFASMSSACRRCIRKAEKEGVIVEHADPNTFAEEYYAQLKDVFAKQRLVPPYQIGRVEELIRQLYPTGQLLLLRARDCQGRSVATGIFPHLNGTMYFWGGASWREHQSCRPNEALQWFAMQWAKEIGVRAYDMGGGGEYKRKYGGVEILVPWFRKSKYSWLGHLRVVAQRSHLLYQQCLGQMKHFHVRREPSSA
ncbi:MAG: GNAT family N-acetyltransferase [Nitrospira sp.]|nr:GNAT family N-acetyltransferase [Nitrospira sp.]